MFILKKISKKFNLEKNSNSDISEPYNIFSYNSLNNINNLNNIKAKTKDIQHQNFGSTTIRNVFSSSNFKNNINNMYNILEEKNKFIKSKSFNDINNNNYDRQILDKKKEYETNIYNYLLKEKYLYEKNLLKMNLGPGKYDLNTNKYKDLNELKNAQNFGSSEIRFPVSLSGIVTPGAGRYLPLKIWGKKKKYTNPFISEIIKIEKFHEKSKKNKNKMILRKLLNIEKNKSPSVWDYYPEKYLSIEYDNQKIHKKNNNMKNDSDELNNIMFEVNKDKLINKNQKENNINNFYKFNDFDNHKVKFKQQIAPFLSTEKRKGFETIEMKDINEIVGPGYYHKDSYFDWNKKSYNLLFN